MNFFNKLPLWLQKLLIKIRNTIFPVLLCCVIILSSPVQAFAASQDVPFVVEVHNYPEDSNIHYGSSAVQIDTSASTQPKLVFDVVIPRSILKEATGGYYDFMFVLHHTVSGKISLNAQFYDYDNNLMGTASRGMQSPVQTASTTYIRADKVSGVDCTKLGRVHITVTWPSSSSSYSETLLMTVQAVLTDSNGNVDSIVSAITNQTDVIGGKIDQTNDYINNGNENTGDLINNVSSANSELNEIWGNYEEIEKGYIDDFEEQHAALTDNFTGFDWAGAGPAVTWVARQMSYIYDSLGDFQMYILFPLLMGIAMFFIGRGKVVFRNLGRGGKDD